MSRPATGAAGAGARPDLTTGPIAKTLLVFSLPALGSNVLQSINGSVNAVWVGQFLGERGLAATANANLLMFLVVSIVFGFGMAATVIIGQSMGRRDIDGVRRATGTGMSLFVLLGILAAVLGWLFSPVLLRLLGTPADVFPSALAYLRVIFLGMPWMLATLFLSMALRGTGDSMTPLWAVLPGLLTDIGLNPVFITGMGPFPELGITGAAVATLIANLVSFLCLAGAVYARDLPIRLRGPELRYLRPQPALARLIVGKGVPMGLQMIIMSGSSLVMLAFVNGEGTNTLAGYGAINQIWTYIQMPAIAIGMAVSTMAAQNIGAGRWDRVDQVANIGMLINVCMTGALVIASLLLERGVLTLFLPQSPEAARIAGHIGDIASWSFILMGVTMVLSSVTRANGATLAPLIIMIIAYIPGRIGATLLLRPHLGADAIWWSFLIGGLASLVLTYGYYRFGGWRKIALMAPVSPIEGEELAQTEADPAGRMAPNG